MITRLLKYFLGSALWLIILTGNLLGQSDSTAPERLRLIHADWGGGEMIGDHTVRLLVGNVEFRQGEAFMKCDSCVQYLDDQRLEFEGNVEIFNNQKWLYADHVIYYEESQIDKAAGHVRLVDTTKTLLAQRLTYFEKEEKAFAKDSVRIIDDANRLTLTGNYAEYYRNDGYAKVTDSPFMSKKDTTDAIELTIVGKVMEMFDDGDRVTVQDSVTITRGAVVATCGKVEYLDQEEKVILSENPQAKRKWDDLWGDEIVLLLKDTEVEAIDIHGQAVVMSRVDTLAEDDSRFDFLNGEKIFIWLQDEAIDSVRITDRATSYYYVMEDGEDKGLNKVLGDEIKLYFSENELKHVRVKSSPGTTTGTYYPPAQTYMIESELKGIVENRLNNK